MRCFAYSKCNHEIEAWHGSKLAAERVAEGHGAARGVLYVISDAPAAHDP